MHYLKSVTLLGVLTLFLVACGGEEKEVAPCSCSCPKANPNRPAWCPVDGTTGTMIDERDNNRQYKTVIINCQEWMAENYRRETGVYFVPHGDGFKELDVAVYGLLYARNTVVAEDFCPSGWHVPNNAEYEAFLTYVNNYRGSSDALLALIAKSPEWLLYPNKGGNDFGFSAMPAGAKVGPDLYMNAGYRAYIWSTTTDGKYGYFLRIGDISDGTAETKASVEGRGLWEAYSARCLRDSLPQAAN